MNLKKLGISLFLLLIAQNISGEVLFDRAINEKSVQLNEQMQYRFTSYIDNNNYKDVALVKSSIISNLLSLSELSFTDSDNKEYIFERVANRNELKYSLWYGRCDENDITLIVDNGKITGTIALEKEIYQIVHLVDDVHLLALLNNNFYEDEIADYPSEGINVNSELELIEPISLSGGTIQITILFAYTDDVVAVHGISGIQSMIQVAETETNQSFINSGANVEVDVVHMVEVNYNETGNAATDLTWFANNTYIQSLRNQYGADVCMIIVDNSNSYGRVIAINASSNDSYAIIRDDVVTGRYTPGHELGHLIGARHNIEHDPTLGPYPANHGYLEPVWPQSHPEWMTMMGVNDLKFNPSGVRQKQWSRPTYYGNTANSNVVNVLNNYAERVANFKTAPLAVDVTGPTTLIGTQELIRAPQYHATGTWTANASGGTGTYSYQWQYYGYYGWTDYSGETSASMTKTLYYDPDGHDLRCVVSSGTATESDQIHVYVTGDEIFKKTSIPEIVVLSSIYPNPFNPVTQIEFALPAAQKVEMNVYSITGEKIKTLINSSMDAGYHSVMWNATDNYDKTISSGVYILHFKCGNEVYNKKMVYTK